MIKSSYKKLIECVIKIKPKTRSVLELQNATYTALELYIERNNKELLTQIIILKSYITHCNYISQDFKKELLALTDELWQETCNDFKNDG